MTSARTIRLSVNQPYFFPYIGFFQLLHASSKFVSLDDANFIKRGWINRNRILINGKPNYLNLQIVDASQNRKICETKIDKSSGWKEDILKKLRISYSRAPFYTDTFTVVRNTLDTPSDLVSDISFQSILEVCNYLKLRREFGRCQGDVSENGEGRIIGICKKENAGSYINLPGGRELYEREKFRNEGIELLFIEPKLREYKQFGGDFVPGLSIIDVMMFNSPEAILEMISDYVLS